MNKRWLYAASIRALKTFCQAFLGTVGTEAVKFHEVDWSSALSIAIVAAILSIANSCLGLPEVDLEENSYIDEE